MTSIARSVWLVAAGAVAVAPAAAASAIIAIVTAVAFGVTTRAAVTRVIAVGAALRNREHRLAEENGLD